MTIEAPLGYPVFLDGRICLIGSGQNSISALDENGNPLWTYFSRSPLTGIDAAGKLILASSLDGTMEIIGEDGSLVYSFEPGGSRIPCIYGSAISPDGAKIALVSGLDEQRFLFLERSGDSYRVAYHENLGQGFRRPVQLAFIDSGNRVAFEREGGLGIFDTGKRTSVTIPLSGKIHAIDDEGEENFLFVITGDGSEKKLVALRYPDRIFLEAPFKSESPFLARRKNELFIGSGDRIMALALRKH
jgi:hypothetical protein